VGTTYETEALVKLIIEQSSCAVLIAREEDNDSESDSLCSITLLDNVDAVATRFVKFATDARDNYEPEEITYTPAKSGKHSQLTCRYEFSNGEDNYGTCASELIAYKLSKQDAVTVTTALNTCELTKQKK